MPVHDARGNLSAAEVLQPTQTIYAPASAPYTASGNSGDLNVDQLRELAVDINVTAATGTTPSLTLTLNRKGADGVYYPIWTSAAITATGKTSRSVGAGLATNESFGGVVQLAWAITGTTPSFTMTISIQGK